MTTAARIQRESGLFYAMHSEHPAEPVLPDFFALCPFAWSGPSPYYSPENRISTEWMLGHLSSLFVDQHGPAATRLRKRMYASCAELLGAHANPYADADGLRIASDFVMILFVLDEITDAQDAEGACETHEVFVRALTGESGDDESPLYEAPFRRLERDPRPFCKALHLLYLREDTEACLRAKHEVLSIAEYTTLRRENGGVRPCFDLIEVILGITLPSEVFEDPDFMRVHFAAVDMICWSNDIYSYASEYENGLEACNAVTVLMQDKGLSLQGAVEHIAELFKDFADTITTCKENIRSFGPEKDETVRMYIYGMEQWVYGNLVWSFDSKRYFGVENNEVRRTGIVKLKGRETVM